LLPRMACIFFSPSLSPFLCSWPFIYISYSPLLVKFSKMANFNFRESWFGFFLFSEIRDQKK
jgi:hypothetical protein